MTSFTDDFNRADSTDLGAGWVEVSGDWSITSNQLSPGAAGGTIILRAAGAMATDDNSAQVTIAATTAASQGVWCRGNSNITSGYLWRNDGTSWDLFSVVGGSFSMLGTYVAAAASGDVAKVQAVGSTIKAFVNGVERVSVTDTGVTTGTSVGIRSESAGALRYDSFTAADVSAHSTVTGTAAAPLGALTAAATGRPTVNATATGALGNLIGSASGRPTVNATATAQLGGSNAVAVATRTVNATASAPLGTAAASATGARTVHATATAPLGVLTGQAHSAQLVTGTGSAPLGGLTATAVVPPPEVGGAVGAGWYGLMDILAEGADLRRSELERDPQACFDCGEPLRTGPDGQLYCSFDGQIWEAGNRRAGLVGSTHN